MSRLPTVIAYFVPLAAAGTPLISGQTLWVWDHQSG